MFQVLIAQERMANNHVYVFKKSMPSKYSYIAEVRSVIENSSGRVSGMAVKMTTRGGSTGRDRNTGPTICAQASARHSCRLSLAPAQHSSR